MPRKAYHHGDLQPALLRAVETVLREKGIEGLSMRECARRAGVSWSAPIHHFRDKTGMLTAFAIEGFEALTALMKSERDAESNPMARAACVGAAYIQFALTQREHFRVMFRPEFLDTKSERFKVACQSPYEVLEDAFRECDAATGRPDHGDLDARCLLAWASVHGFATLCLEGALDVTERPAWHGDRMAIGKQMLELMGPSLFNFPAEPYCDGTSPSDVMSGAATRSSIDASRAIG